MCLARPPGIVGQSLRGKAGRNRGGGLDWLLVEARAGRAHIVEALGAHRPEQACRRFLASDKPTEATQAGSDIGTGAGRATDPDQRFAETSIVVGKVLLEPCPLGRLDALK